MRIFSLSVLLALSLCPALAYDRPHAVSLGGEWEFLPVEPLIDIVEDRYARPDWPKLSPKWDEVVSPDAAPPEDAEWMQVQVPLAWEHYTHPGYNEAGWYRKTLELPAAWLEQPDPRLEITDSMRRRFWLEFDAVATAAGVWANGVFVGGHVGDYSRWRVELSDAVRAAGEGKPLELLVYVDELPGHITQGFYSMIAPHHGGIWQDVRIYLTPAASIEPDGLSIEYDRNTQTTTIRAELDLASGQDFKDLGFFFTTPNRGAISTNYSTPGLEFDSESGLLAYTVEGSLGNPWTPENPEILPYELHIMGHDPLPQFNQDSMAWDGADFVRQNYAFRDIQMREGQVYLNDQPLRIRSVLNWGVYPEVFGPAPSPETVRKEFAYIKSLGFNAETICLVNMPDYFYDIADKMGVLIWQEYPTWHNDFDLKHLPTYRREFPAYFKRDRNHPSIIMRSLSVEAGVKDWEVIDELYAMAKEMTDTPVQDNNSWFSHSRPEYTDWYGEDNYFNNAQWALHLTERLPERLDEYPEKPYIIGESILFNTWPDIDALEESLAAGAALRASPPAGAERGPYPDTNGMFASPAINLQTWQPPDDMLDYTGGPSDYPWWFPSCFDACRNVNAQLRARYSPELPAGQDIVRDYLIPQSTKYALECRKFQIEMLHCDPRYAGYTVNCIRDMPLIRAGLLNNFDVPRWTAEDWAWHGDQTGTPQNLSAWEGTDSDASSQAVPVLALREGYLDLQPLLGGWDVRWIDDWELDETRAVPLPTEQSKVVITSVLTHKLVDFIDRGGVVILLTSKWPGGLGSFHHYFWRDAIFVPPVGPWWDGISDRIVELQPYDLNLNTTQVIPVEDLGISDNVDPLLRLFDTHDLSEVVTYDQVFATKAGTGMLIASSLDHTTPAGQWVLGLFAGYANEWAKPSARYMISGNPGLVRQGDFPKTGVQLELLHSLAVTRPNGIMPLDEGWWFKLDAEQTGEASGWMNPGFDFSGWDSIRAGAGWEALGYSYDGMAWYVREVDAPEDWADGKLRLVAEGIDDAYTVWVNGKAVATHGSFTEHEKTVWQQQTVTDLTDFLIPGQTNTLALQVVDITGQGGIWKPVYIAVD